MTRLLAIYRQTASDLDALRGAGTARSEVVGMMIILGGAALIALGLAAITGDA